ncbi:PE-PGRS family protein [Vulgatibacter incomptus]|uniref:PE-PGRS family protein n=1 Tax=Vulgatibacter incomptus TaxID=1391653 RepID=A0A0K1PI50_9BACT|nr:PE-PGRS family protein [Vulgatibacter incomptus]AKU93197.1 hypothetical protein AKJ08_3584 [Vulgatibacter incomptus]
MGPLRLLAVSASIVVSLVAFGAVADEIHVHDAAGLVDAARAAKAGDEIVLATGTYRLSGVSCSAAGTPDAPILVRSAEPLGAHIEFDGVEGFKVSGAHWHFEGLDISGVCADHSDCEHAFHVVGEAHGFVLRASRVRDFNAQLKVNAALVDGRWVQPNDGQIVGCEIFDTEPRRTSNPVTKLNIDSGRSWIVQGSYLHDFEKAGGNRTSYAAFMKSGGEDGLFERNLVVCSTSGSQSGTRVGLSFGGGGTAPQFCAPAFDADVRCDVEHRGGTMRNNIVASCSDVGIYLNRAADTKLLFNTLVATSGIDFHFDTTTGLAHGNLLSGRIRDRDGASHVDGPNLNVPPGFFDRWYRDPAHGDLWPFEDPSASVGSAAAHPDVTDDYCGRTRPENPTQGALEHGLGACKTLPPPGLGTEAGGSGGSGGTDIPDRDGDTGGTGGSDDPWYPEDRVWDDDVVICGCASGSGTGGDALLALLLGLALVLPARPRQEGR